VGGQGVESNGQGWGDFAAGFAEAIAVVFGGFVARSAVG
jgi:hypothetical protein